MARLRSDVVAAVTLVGREERRLFGEILAALVGYAVWVGLTGVALFYGAGAAGIETTADPWSGGKTALVGVALLAWVVLPAVLAAWLLVDRMTNVSDNLHQHYRFRRPGALLVPPLALLAVGVGALVGLGGAWPAQVLVVAASLFVLVRTVAFGYRVFTLSVPVLMRLLVLLATPALALALLTGAATAAGRQATLVAVADGFGGGVGVAGLGALFEGVVDLGAVALPPVVVVAVAVTAGLPLGYVAVQLLAGLVNRLRGPEVRRSELRTGQRYPEFVDSAATTTTTRTTATGAATTDTTATGSGAGSSGPTDATAGASAGTTTASDGAGTASAGDGGAATVDGETDDTEGEMVEDVSNTRMFTPPEDGGEPAFLDDTDTGSADGGDAVGTAVEGTEGAETAVGGNTGGADDEGVCSACGESYNADAGYVFCPNCGEDV